MLVVKINDRFVPEKRYILETLLHQFLGLEFTLNISPDNVDYELNFNNTTKIIIKECDLFKKHYTHELDYLHLDNIPDSIFKFKNEFTDGQELVVLYGTNVFTKTRNSIISGVDIFASSFYMLTRWEEFVIKERDLHDRFESRNSLAKKFSFLKRPIVNEYVAFLKNMISYLTKDAIFTERKYEVMISHDVDVPFYWGGNKLKRLVVELLDTLRERSFATLPYRLFSFLKTVLQVEKDPYDTFDYLMHKTEEIGSKSHFFFMSGGTSARDNSYQLTDKKIVDLIQKIVRNKHYIGFHPSYNAYNNQYQFSQELKSLKRTNFNFSLIGREHYLRFEVPKTWQIWSDNNMLWDSTMAYADNIGFRCGSCYEFTVYNILTRKKLSVKEVPLIVMDCSLFDYEKLSEEEAIIMVQELSQLVKLHGGTFTFLWHNSYFLDMKKRTDRYAFYEKVLEIIE